MEDNRNENVVLVVGPFTERSVAGGRDLAEHPFVGGLDEPGTRGVDRSIQWSGWNRWIPIHHEVGKGVTVQTRIDRPPDLGGVQRVVGGILRQLQI